MLLRYGEKIAIIQLYSDAGNSKGEIPKKSPFFVLARFCFECPVRQDTKRNLAQMVDTATMWSGGWVTRALQISLVESNI